jgi:hypothetical protein
MKRLIFPAVLALTFSTGFVGCGGGGSEAEQELQEQRAELDRQQQRIDRIKALQLKQKDGQLSAEEEAELNDLYAQIESEGNT